MEDCDTKICQVRGAERPQLPPMARVDIPSRVHRPAAYVHSCQAVCVGSPPPDMLHVASTALQAFFDKGYAVRCVGWVAGLFASLASCWPGRLGRRGSTALTTSASGYHAWPCRVRAQHSQNWS
jgi:hypothetical protein